MLGGGECRNAIDEALRALGRTSTIWPRDATKPLECARTRYGPGDSVRSSKRPARSVTAVADVVPRADTIAPATGAPFSSCTVPRIEPGASEATWVMALTCGTACAVAGEGRQRSTRPPSAADAVILAVLRMMSPGSALVLGRADREIDLPGQRLVRELVR